MRVSVPVEPLLKVCVPFIPQCLDYEVELAFVIGKTGKHIKV